MTAEQRAKYQRRFEAWQACMDFGFEWGLQLARWRHADRDPLEVFGEQLAESSRQHHAGMVELARRLSEVASREEGRSDR